MNPKVFPSPPALLRTLLLLTLSLFAAGPGRTAPLAEGQLRIRVLEQQAPRTVVLEGPAGLSLFSGDNDAPIARLGPGEQATVSVHDGELALALPGTRIHTRSLHIFPPDEADVRITVTRGLQKDVTRSYQGSLYLIQDPDNPVLQLVNHVEVEDYVASVVASEYGLKDLEGSKAMAVIARTYALHALGEAGDAYDHVDHTLSQVYGGTDRITPLARQAARETYGEVLTFEGHLIDAVYFSASGGHTADNEAVWLSKPLPYLRGKQDPYDTSPYAAWSTSVSRKNLLEVLSQAFGFRVSGLRIADRSRDGRVKTLSLLRDGGPDRTIPANDFRLAYIRAFGASTLRSTFFTVRTQGNDYVFQGRGFGHGVGLSQWGAHEMARQGHSYREILSFYYTGVRLQKKVSYADLHPAPRPAGLGDAAALPPAEASETPAQPARKKPRRRIGW